MWTLHDQWEKLWEDVRTKADARLLSSRSTPHFLGAVVLEPQAREGLLGVDKLQIIDGQQRLTTLQFVLASLVLAMRQAGHTGLQKIVEDCQWNSNANTMRDPDTEKYKVWPTFRDREQYQRAISVDDLPQLRERFPDHFTSRGDLRRIGIVHPPALSAIWNFSRWFTEWLHQEEPSGPLRSEALVQAVLQDLKLVSISLEADDDAQVIFETLNGRGAQLNATDLIRNYVFMTADKLGENATQLYDRHWVSFEDRFWGEAQRRGRITKPRLEWLVHAALQAELREDVDLGRLYADYRRFATSSAAPLSGAAQLEMLQEYAAAYRLLVGSKADTTIGRFGRRIEPYDITTLYPLALLIARAPMSDVDRADSYGILASYLVRRAVCGLTPKNYNSVFLSALKQLGSLGASPGNLRAVLEVLKGDASRWPGDGEFRAACLNAPLYPGRLDARRMRAMLTEIEGELRRSVRTEEAALPVIDLPDVDHVMPRSWTQYWNLSDGSVVTRERVSAVEMKSLMGDPLDDVERLIAERQAIVPTLGNLTLLDLSVNREAQNFAFASKRKLLIENTALRLNVPMVATAVWDEATIRARGEQLADAALRVWPGPRAVPGP
ncbi:MAG: DUF262 domain-containing protein [Steroidobacteraceae bacterium]